MGHSRRLVHRAHVHEFESAPVVSQTATAVTIGATTKPVRSPWGDCQDHEVLAPGLVQVTTASHGGIHVDRWRMAQMPDVLRSVGGGGPWFEEDCNWAAPVIAFRQEFSPRLVDAAISTLRQWHPDAYEAYFQEVIPPGLSSQKDSRVFHEQHTNDLLVTTAFPADQARERFAVEMADDQVLVFAARGGDRTLMDGSKRGECGVFLVNKERYRSRGQFSHVIDPTIDSALDEAATARCLA